MFAISPLRQHEVSTNSWGLSQYLKFEQEKKVREAKKKQHVMDVKEIKMRYKIEEHDYLVKLKSAQKFLSDGDKIKVWIIQLCVKPHYKNAKGST